MAAAGGGDVEIDPSDPDAEKLPEEQKGIIMAMIKQLKPGNGMDLSRVTLPTFILEPRSLLERFTDFLTHAQYIISIHAEADPLQRFLSVVRWFISGYHIRPTGVKKPYNPILGECCRAETHALRRECVSRATLAPLELRANAPRDSVASVRSPSAHAPKGQRHAPPAC
jgi:hypothetical protein